MASSIVKEFGCLVKMESILRPFPLAHSEANRWHGLDGPVWSVCDRRMPAYFSRVSRACRDHGRLRMPGARIFLIVFPFRSNPCPSCSSKCAGLTVGLLGSGRDGSKEGEAGSYARGDGPRQKRRRRLCYRNQEQGCVKRLRWHCFSSWDTASLLFLGHGTTSCFSPSWTQGKGDAAYKTGMWSSKRIIYGYYSEEVLQVGASQDFQDLQFLNERPLPLRL